MIIFLLFTVALATQCAQDLQNLLEIKLEELGKILYYSGRDFDDLGKYDECIEKKDFDYALVSINYDVVHAYLGICLPRSCSAQEIKIFVADNVNKVTSSIRLTSENINVHFSKQYSEESLSFSAYLALMFFILIAIAAIIGTSIDIGVYSPEKKSLLVEILQEFSVPKSYEKLFSFPDQKDNLVFINGLRAISLCGIIYFHIYNNHARAAIGNLFQVIDIFKDFPHKFILIQRQFVEIFFIISGFLLSYLTLPQLYKARSSFSWKNFIIHRVLRLTPVYYSTLIYYAFLFRYTGSGPQWSLHEELTYEGCNDYWYSNFLYLQDVYPSGIQPCMPWSWYVAADLHMFMASTIVLYAYSRNKLWGYLCCVVIALSCFTYIGVMSTENDFTPSFYGGWTTNKQTSYIYNNSLSRINTFLIGIIIGFLYRAHADSKQKADEKVLEEGKDPKRIANRIENFLIRVVDKAAVRKLFYFIGLVLMLGSGLLVHDLDKNGVDHWSQSTKSFYLAMQYFSFGLGFSFWFFPMLLGHCSFLNGVLSINSFIFMAKISFAMYLIHPIIIRYFVFSRYQRLIMNDQEMFYLACSTIFISMIFASMLSLLVEVPFLTLEKKYFRG